MWRDSSSAWNILGARYMEPKRAMMFARPCTLKPMSAPLCLVSARGGLGSSDELGGACLQVWVQLIQDGLCCDPWLFSMLLSLTSQVVWVCSHGNGRGPKESKWKCTSTFSRLLTCHWPKQVTWLSRVTVGESYEGLGQRVCLQGKWRIGLISSINLTSLHCP